MIQRIQSIFLFVSSACFLIASFSPLLTHLDPEGESYMGIASFVNGVSLGVGALVCIFLYKKRASQIKTAYTLLICCVLWYFMIYLDFRTPFLEYSGLEYGLGMILPLPAALLLLLAVHFIKKDERLVRSMDRLRD